MGYRLNSERVTMHKRLMQLRDLPRMRAHFGWGHYICAKSAAISGPHSVLAKHIQRYLESHTDNAKASFDAQHGTETCSRCDVTVREGADDPGMRWGYSAICGEFLQEMLESVPEPLSNYGFVDVGSGKGAAIMHARNFPFHRFYGVELTLQLVEIALRNCRAYSVSTDLPCDNCGAYNESTSRPCGVTWICSDFFRWSTPKEPLLFFLNNPFPEALNVPAIEHIEASVARNANPVLLVFRKVPANTARYLDQSKLWQPVRLAPYWRIYASQRRPNWATG
jgi:hypothetical protein